ncbi:PEP-utilizing enzyme [Endozoicomonas lisbonensis]|uniref:Choline kinase/phosphohistidine swiveling domain-containing protein n=1 Tax=Endozoicomonas lisbonensis TaxID=3120522 RepID=A0ABV2SQ13_9GAMM
MDQDNKVQCCILSAGKHQNLDSACCLLDFSNGKSILDWQIYSLKAVFPNPEVRIAVGYKYNEIVEAYPCLNFTHIVNWKNGSPLRSFLEIPVNTSSPVLVMYGDTVFRNESIRSISKIDSDVVIGIDSKWLSRYSNRNSDDILRAEKIFVDDLGEIEYTGLLYLSSKTVKFIKNSIHVNNLDTFISLVDFLKNNNFTCTYFDVNGDWAEMNQEDDLVQFLFGTKAQTLNRIRPRLKKSTICDQYVCRWDKWINNKIAEVDAIQSSFLNQKLIVRSSSYHEDGWHTANAGAFESVLDIDSSVNGEVFKAIELVFNSYPRVSEKDQVLVQPFIDNTVLSGVIFTCDLATGSPYYTINYDDKSGSTESVTSGLKSNLRTITLSRKNPWIIKNIDDRLTKLIDAVQEIEDVVGFNKLDIEFALDEAGELFTFQVRPIVVEHCKSVSDEKIYKQILFAQNRFSSWQNASLDIKGEFTVFSNMADWNPAEIIGQRPSVLAVSLYRHLITDEIWARQRHEFGYRNIHPAPLVHTFCMQPYVDCRASLNSFIPDSVPDDTAERLVIAYLNILKNNPELHDKVELEIAFTIWTPTFREEANGRLLKYGVTREDIDLLEDGLKDLTKMAFTRLGKDLEPLDELDKRFNYLKSSKLGLMETAYQSIELCKEFGTLAFSHAARAGFVAISFLHSLVRCGVITKSRMLDFQSSISTVTRDFQADCLSNSMTLDELVIKYGHLRPGTYDVNQKAYWEMPEFYFYDSKPSDDCSSINKKEMCETFIFSRDEMNRIQEVLENVSNSMNSTELIEYFSNAIQAREKAKFIFTRNLSLALDCLSEYGRKELNIDRTKIGYLSWSDISDFSVGQASPELLKCQINSRESYLTCKQLVKLPAFISSVDDFLGFEHETSSPNFITHNNTVAELSFIDSCKNENLEGKIAVIPGADPGYDWLFSHGISGLITKYGGANSHMAIRCAELNLPAVIGVGDKLYSQLSSNRIYMLDCMREKIEHV